MPREKASHSPPPEQPVDDPTVSLLDTIQKLTQQNEDLREVVSGYVNGEVDRELEALCIQTQKLRDENLQLLNRIAMLEQQQPQLVRGKHDASQNKRRSPSPLDTPPAATPHSNAPPAEAVGSNAARSVAPQPTAAEVLHRTAREEKLWLCLKCRTMQLEHVTKLFADAEHRNAEMSLLIEQLVAANSNGAAQKSVARPSGPAARVSRLSTNVGARPATAAAAAGKTALVVARMKAAGNRQQQQAKPPPMHFR